MTDEQVVKRVWPEASVWRHGSWRDGFNTWKVYDTKHVHNKSQVFGVGESPETAWADAASRIRAAIPETVVAPKPACEHNGGYNLADPGPFSDDIVLKICKLCGQEVTQKLTPQQELTPVSGAQEFEEDAYNRGIEAAAAEIEDVWSDLGGVVARIRRLKVAKRVGGEDAKK